MADTIKIKTNQGDQYNLTTTNDIYVLLEGISIQEFNPPGNGIFADTAFSGNLIRALGRIDALGNAISSAATDTDVEIGNTAKLTGLNGVSFTGNHSSLVNWGAISGIHRGIVMSEIEGDIINNGAVIGQNNEAISVSDGDYEIINNGSLTGQVGIHSSGSDLVVRLGADSIINTIGAAIIITSTTADHSRVTNNGLMATSGITAYGGGDGADRLINHGTILGEVRFAGGEDVFDGRGGYVSGRILGSAGDDTFIIDDSRADIFEVASEGDDTIRSSMSYKLTTGQEIEHLVLTGSHNTRATGNDLANQLIGNAGANVLEGMAGIDGLNGGRGNDRMTGGLDQDTFVFAKGGGDDRILDFDIATDLLDLSKWDGVETLARVRAHAREEHGGLMIEAGSDSLFLAGIDKNDVTGANFADM
ncbi:hypothetical protein [Rhizobium sp. LjRoot254]|uniref:hypothetical protein n=1 Tax=Rhizobium sp. LjRoot254 TaxID=3342297 RepID=UPI003ECC3DBD